MKPQIWLARLGWLTLSCSLLGALTLGAREYYEDQELRGQVLKVDLKNKAITLDPGGTHKIKLIFWNHKTVFRRDAELVKLEELKTNMQVRIYYRDDLSVSRSHKAIANKVVLKPTSDRNLPEYNR
jgi:hypothetical protein